MFSLPNAVFVLRALGEEERRKKKRQHPPKSPDRRDANNVFNKEKQTHTFWN